MKIIAIADTHITYGSVLKQLPDNLAALLRDADLVIHAGDFITKNAYDELSGMCRLLAVHGNMDEVELKEALPERYVTEIEGIRLGIVHEASLSLQDTTGVRYMAKEMGVNVLVFGHIHRPVIDRSDVLLVCPGSPTAPRLSEPSSVELRIDAGKISGNIITFGGTGCCAFGGAGAFHT